MTTALLILIIWLLLSIFFLPKASKNNNPLEKITLIKVILFLPLVLCFLLYRLSIKIWN